MTRPITTFSPAQGNSGLQMPSHTSSTIVADCKFCYTNIASNIIAGTDSGAVFAVRDRYPVAEGHTLVIPRRHVAAYFDLTDDERRAADNLMLNLFHRMASEDPRITGYNIGVNNGASAGQTIFHVHYHLIPRRDGDTTDPRGGVRGVMPGKRGYQEWKVMPARQ